MKKYFATLLADSEFIDSINAVRMMIRQQEAVMQEMYRINN